MGKIYQDLLIIEHGRIFIDVAYHGCGNGCKYCYVKSASEEQKLASYEDLTQVIEYLKRSDWPDHQIVSFCPNTEPFKTKDSIKKVLFLLQGLKDCQFHIQISTKEYLDDTLLYELNNLAEKNTLFINISMPFLETLEIEPGAADITRRISNIERIRYYAHLKCGLYIKPFTLTAIKNVERYIDIINRALPDYVCTGVAFDKNVNTPCVSLHRENDAAKIISAQKYLLTEFAEELKSSIPCPIVYSSICIIFQTYHCKCFLNLWRYDKNLCNFCNVF